jgi:hypothetical protein
MSAQSASPQANASLPRRILGSFLAAFVGYTPPVLLLAIVGLLDRRHMNAYGWRSEFAFVFIFGKYVFSIWLFVLLPLYLLVPLRSVLWRWPVCTACGAVSGALIQFIWFRRFGGLLPLSGAELVDEIPALCVAAFVGASACLFGSLTAHRFHFARST